MNGVNNKKIACVFSFCFETHTQKKGNAKKAIVPLVASHKETISSDLFTMRQAPIIRWLLLTLLAFQVFGFSPVKTFTRPSLSLAQLAASAEGFTIADHKGNAIGVGSIVRVIAKDLKAYQVSPKGFGKFDDSGKFVPAPQGGARGTKNLVIPVGLVGIVTKVYDEDDVSANFPIQAKFVPGAPFVEKYDPTVPFLMHFLPEELECVE